MKEIDDWTVAKWVVLWAGLNFLSIFSALILATVVGTEIVYRRAAANLEAYREDARENAAKLRQEHEQGHGALPKEKP